MIKTIKKQKSLSARTETILKFLDTQPKEVAVAIVKTIDQIFLTLAKATATQKLSSLEKDLREFSTNGYSKASQEALERALKALKGNAKFSEIDRDKMIRELDQALKKFAKKSSIKKKIAGLIALAYLIIRRGSRDRLGLSPYAATNIDKRIEGYLTDSQLIWIGLHFSEHLSKKIKKIILKSILKKHLTRKQAVPIIRDKIGKLFSIEKTESYFDVLAATVIEQSRNFAMLQTLKEAGEKEYMLWNPMDERTSDICKMMHGQVFKIDDALKIRDRIVKAKTPEKIKTIAPWLKFEDVLDRAGISTAPKKLTSKVKSRLAAAGIMIPPFHGRCRTRIRRTTKITKFIDYQLDETVLIENFMERLKKEGIITAEVLEAAGKLLPKILSRSGLSGFGPDKKKKEVMTYPLY